jgi:hypothetical protein
MTKYNSDSDNNRFTIIIKQLNEDSCFLPKSVFHSLFKAIAKTLREKMSQRGLWISPTNYLGYPSADHWNQDSSLFEEIVFDCYMFAIAKRLRSLRNAMQRFDNIDGLVFRNINNFLTERQRIYDPIGYAVAQNLICAIQHAIELEIIIPNDLRRGKICNQTSFSFESSNFKQTTDYDQLISKVILNNYKWLKIRKNLAKRNKRVQQELCEILCGFKDAGIKHFKFKPLVDIMKDDVRASYVKIDEPQEEFSLDCEELNRIFHNWYLNMVQLIELSNHQRRVRHNLKLIFMARVKAITNADKIPSQSDLAKQLNLSVGTINADIKILREYAEEITNDYKSNSLSIFIDKILK